MGYQKSDERIIVLAMMSLPRIGKRTVHRFLAEYSSRLPEDASILSNAIRETVNGVSRKVAAGINDSDVEVALEKATKLMDEATQKGIYILSWGDLPERVKSIPDPPVMLFLKGNRTLINDNSFAIIGTRNPTERGIEVAKAFAFEIAKSGYVVVSGLAKGCDAAAHRGCLDAEGKTIAVLAHGLDQVYPAENRELAEEIVERQGCLVSEYAPGTQPLANYFVERDRLQSGLSLGVIVAETGLKSGTLHTVGFAEGQKRPLACWSPDTGEEEVPESRLGNLDLIKTDRAIPIRTRRDLKVFVENCLNGSYEGTGAGENTEKLEEGGNPSQTGQKTEPTPGFETPMLPLGDVRLGPGARNHLRS